MKILAFETSCDETSCAVIEDGRKILSNVISTQVPIHKKFGGVVPEIASRHHIEDVLPVAIEALEEARAGWEDIDAVAVTQGPGLVGALLVGVAAAKTAAWVLGKPLIAVNHMEGHIFANLLQYSDLEPPFLSLVVSGGHTMLVVVRDYNTFELLGQTRDDASVGCRRWYPDRHCVPDRWIKCRFKCTSGRSESKLRYHYSGSSSV